MEKAIDYKAEILQDLAFIPEEEMKTLYKIIHLIAKPHKTKPDPKPDRETLQAYADQFRKGFSLVMKKDMGLNFFYQVQEKFTILKLHLTSSDAQETDIIEEDFDLEKLCTEKEVEIIFNEQAQKHVLKALKEIEDVVEDKYSEKMLIPDGRNIYFIEVSDKSKWQTDNASDDGRNLFGLLLKIGTVHRKAKQEQIL